MYEKSMRKYNLNICQEYERYINPSDINIVNGYKIGAFVQGLDSPVSMLFAENGDLIIAESGYTSGNPRVLRLVNEHFEVIAENFQVPITGINYLHGLLYISHRGFVSVLKPDGTRQDIITGLPSNGDYVNSRVVFGPNEKLYFGQGTATNSGVVGPDNDWLLSNPLVHDYPGDYIMLHGQNFESTNLFIAPKERVYTGAYSPYGVPNSPNEVKKGVTRTSGSILRANYDGTGLEHFAWGFRNPSYIDFDNIGRLFVSNNSYETRGSRPIANALNEFFLVLPGLWYGWPDYNAGEPVTLPRFKPLDRPQPELVIKNIPNTPPKPYVTFPTNSGIMGFAFNYNHDFGPVGDVYISEFGSTQPRSIGNGVSYSDAGHKLSKIDMNTRTVSTFAINKSGFPASITKDGGFERPADVVFGPDKAMYILDMGLNLRNDPSIFVKNTGVIWKITRTI